MKTCFKDWSLSTIGLDKQIFLAKIVNIFLPTSFNICFGCSKKTSHLAGSFEHLEHILWLRNKKINFVLRTVLTKVLCALITIASSPKHLAVLFTGWHSTVGNMSGNRFKSDCRSRGREFDPRQVPYFRGD